MPKHSLEQWKPTVCVWNSARGIEYFRKNWSISRNALFACSATDEYLVSSHRRPQINTEWIQVHAQADFPKEWPFIWAWLNHAAFLCRMEGEVIDSPLESANTGAFWKGLILKLHCPGVFNGWAWKCKPLVIVLMRSAYLWFLLGKPVCRNDMGNYKNVPTTPSLPPFLSHYTNPHWEGEKQSHSYRLQ